VIFTGRSGFVPSISNVNTPGMSGFALLISVVFTFSSPTERLGLSIVPSFDCA